ncbi:MAG: hypothetical protein QOG23_4049 [Blastocatellia bacterium]|jgi:hypothetical protein|nr:hypothetical protein [Blastocatellia bacterium]
MARLYLFAEGQTEQTFAGTVLKPHLANLGVYIYPILIAHSRRKHITHRGGVRKYTPVRNDILRFMKQERDADVFFSTMVDLYGLPSDFPGVEQAERLRHDPHQRVRSLEQEWLVDIGDQRFVPFIQLHEYEALLFAEISRLEFFYENSRARIAKLEKIANSVDTPELINDGPQTAPSKRIIAEFPEYEGAKRTVGPQVAELIGLSKIRARCPHFNGWLGKLEGLGTGEERP